MLAVGDDIQSSVDKLAGFAWLVRDAVALN
jgi:hypothetical protein